MAVPYVALLFGWCLALGRAGRATKLGRRLGAGAVGIGSAGCSALGLAAVALPFPQGSMPQLILGVPALVLGVGAFLAIPIWLIRMSSILTHAALTPEPTHEWFADIGA